MGIFVAIIVGLAIFGMIMAVVKSNQEDAQRERANKMVQQEKDKLAMLDNALNQMNELREKAADSDIISLGGGKVKVKRTYLDANFKEGAIIDEETFFADEDEDGYVTIDESKFKLMQVKKDAYEKAKERVTTTVALNNKGTEQEKSGDEESAIATYEECIKTGYPATHAYDRLLVLYRKRKDYINEKRICQLAIDTFKNEKKYKDRLSKINDLLNEN